MTEERQALASGAGAVAIGRDNHGPVHTGSGDQFISYAGRPPVSWPYRTGVVPPVAAGYLSRTDPGVDLARILGESAGTAVLTQLLTGMGGVGKTQLAAAYAHRVWEAGQVDLLMWLTATGRDAVVTGYAQAGADVAHPAEGEATEQVAARFLSWLASTDKRWLMVLDDLADPADLKGLWPQGRTGQILVTTRRRDAALAERGHVVDVDLFTPDEAVTYLVGRLDPDGEHPERLMQADELAEDLGRLPLALAHAAAYILDQQPLTCAGYRKLLVSSRLESALPATPGDDYVSTVAGTWSLSVQLADRLTPAGLARPLLTLAAELDPNGIPIELFTSDSVRTYLAAGRTASSIGARPYNGKHPALLPAHEAPTTPHRGRLLRRLLPRRPELISRPVLSPSDVAAPVTDQEVAAGLRNLHRLNLITRVDGTNSGGGSVVRVHALVQRATREVADTAAFSAAAKAAADGLLETWPEQDYQPAQALLAQSLRDNVDALSTAAPGPLWSGGAHPVLLRAGSSRTDSGLVVLLGQVGALRGEDQILM